MTDANATKRLEHQAWADVTGLYNNPSDRSLVAEAIRLYRSRIVVLTVLAQATQPAAPAVPPSEKP